MPRQFHILFNLLALFVIMYIVVDTFYGLVGMQLHRMSGEKAVAVKGIELRTAKSSTTPEYTMIVERNIFGATEKAEPPPVVEEKVEPIETLQETSLQLSLLGTIAGDAQSARAIIFDQRQKSQDLYRVGDTVQNAEIRQILRGKVVLRHDGKDEILSMVEGEELPGAGAATDRTSKRGGRAARRTRSRPESIEEAEEEPVETGEVEQEIIALSQDELQDSMDNLNELLTQVRVRPYFRQGKPEGFIVSQIQPDSVFEKLGLLNGDIIASVNGKQMSSPEEAFQLYNSLKSGSQVSIEITRRGQRKLLTYTIQ